MYGRLTTADQSSRLAAFSDHRQFIHLSGDLLRPTSRPGDFNRVRLGGRTQANRDRPVPIAKDIPASA